MVEKGLLLHRTGEGKVHRESVLALVPGGAQKHMLMTAILLRVPRHPCHSRCSWASVELRGYYRKPWGCTHSHPLPPDRLAQNLQFMWKTRKEMNFTLFFFFMGKGGKFLPWVSSSLRQWRAWSNTSERIILHFFSSHFTFCENCIFMSVNSQVGTRWQLSFPENQEVNQAAKMGWLHCEIP